MRLCGWCESCRTTFSPLLAMRGRVRGYARAGRKANVVAEADVENGCGLKPASNSDSTSTRCEPPSGADGVQPALANPVVDGSPRHVEEMRGPDRMETLRPRRSSVNGECELWVWTR